MPILMWLFVIPIVSALLVLLLPLPQKLLKTVAVVLSLIPLALLLFNHMHWPEASVNYPWMPALSIAFHLQVDSLSLIFLYLTAIVVPVSILAVCTDQLEFPNTFYGLVLLLEALLIGFFTARDLALFTIFWEGMLLPLYFIINLWGGPQRQTAALKFLIYMIAGSALMVGAVLALFYSSGSVIGSHTFDMGLLAQVSSATPHAAILFAVFLVAFAVKTPLFPFHAWLPDAYCQASTSGTILLAGILSKAGIYGILRIGMGFFPLLIKDWSPLLLTLSILGVFYGGLAAWMQKDYKRLIAYSSFSHVNFVLAGLFIWHQPAHIGAILQALNHGITITGLFLVAGWLENRLGTTSMTIYSGVAKYMPRLCWLTLIFVLSSVALPSTNNFVGELLIFFGLFGQNPWVAAVLALTVILTVMYMLRWMQTVYFETASPFQDRWKDIGWKHLAIAFPLVFLIFWIGIYPTPVLNLIKPAAETVKVAVNMEMPR